MKIIIIIHTISVLANINMNIKKIWTKIKNIFGFDKPKKDDKEKKSKKKNNNERKPKKWWNNPKTQKWIVMGAAIVVFTIGVASMTYFEYVHEEYQDISWNELAKYVYNVIFLRRNLMCKISQLP